MLPLIVAPDVELWAIGWLRSQLAGRAEPYASGVYLDRRIPSPLRDRMVICRHDGGPRMDMLHDAARLGVNVFAGTEQDATDLAGLVGGLLLSVRASGPVETVTSLSGPTAIDDTRPRRYLTVEVLMRGVLA